MYTNTTRGHIGPGSEPTVQSQTIEPTKQPQNTLLIPSSQEVAGVGAGTI